MKIQNIIFLKEIIGIALIISGVKQVSASGSRYMLTDPAVHSKTQEYGMTDLGIKGMESVLRGHQCNIICHLLGLTNPFTSQDL